MGSNSKIIGLISCLIIALSGYAQDTSYISISELKLTSDSLRKSKKYKDFIEVYNADTRRSSLRNLYLSADLQRLDQCRLNRKFLSIGGGGYRSFAFRYGQKRKSRVTAIHNTSGYVYLCMKDHEEMRIMDSLKVIVSGEPGSIGYLAGDTLPQLLNAATRNRQNQQIPKVDLCSRKVRSFYYGQALSYTFDATYSSVRPMVTWSTGYQYHNQVRPWYFITTGIGFEKKGYRFVHEEKTDVAKGVFTRTLRGKNQFYNMNLSFGSGFNVFSDLKVGMRTRIYLPFSAKEIADETRILTFDDGTQIIDDRGTTTTEYFLYEGFGWSFSVHYDLSENYAVEVVHDTFLDVYDGGASFSSFQVRMHANLYSRRRVYHRNIHSGTLF